MNINGLWDHKDEALFIELVQQYPPLWNTSDKNYPKKGLKRLLYMQIAEELKQRWSDRAHLLTAVSLKKKFNSLRSYFQREQRKMKIWNKMSSSKSFPKWIHFNKMLFLTEKSGSNESECDLNISIEKVEGGVRNGDVEIECNDSVAKASYSDTNRGKNSSSTWEPFVQSSEETVEILLKKEILDDSSLTCDSINTETPVNTIIDATNCSHDTVGMNSSPLLQSSVLSNEENVEPSVKIELLDDSSTEDVSYVTKPSVNTFVAKTSCSFRNERTEFLQPNENVVPALNGRKPNSSPVYDLVDAEAPGILKVCSASVQVPLQFNMGSRNFSVNQAPIEKLYEPMKEIQLNEEAAERSMKKKNPNNSSPMHDSFNAETSCSDRNEETDLSLSLQLSLKSNEEVYLPPLKRKKLSNSTLMCDSTETPVTAIAEISYFDRNEGAKSFPSLQPSVQSSNKAVESPLKRKKLSNISPMCDSTETEPPLAPKTWPGSVQEPTSFNMALGNLVAASLNQMSVEKANSATKEIFEVLLKYGRETNHLR